ncbi:MAG: phosphatase PAP2 family protein [Candidatus Azobacteroides pseudotrichonymphae]|jgi:undecaprenyl-diphosphatase|uniref:Membrane-associated phospholipid phosphatase n=2 Tax=Candidatus Azobacteroides TaxID=511434 RepID=B6YRJ7_AZOPC|nr:phosphatase PAP2 family protein [Bacteroidales bacterium OttesenSCG-928-I14]BAG83819.1 putative membrane-associated phospholipid phosphatase [Candidatus Azobacteroides pseudotrichonymphae genomovar. CFP2]GMO35556.1 MAG: phosphatase PAP2 family protein [Candidatus Azobacteroides pseudotrichonymphae]
MIEKLCHLLEQESQWEKNIFHLLNGRYALGDYFFWLCSNSWLEACIYISCLWIFLHKKNYKEALLVILSVALVFFLCEWISSSLFKPIFHRLRPTYHPDFKECVNTVFGYLGAGTYGFISGHTTNAFGFATITALIFRSRIYVWTILLFACLIGYSRIYLGVHFISDVLVGVLVGLSLGYLVYKLYKSCQIYFLKKNHITISFNRNKTS